MLSTEQMANLEQAERDLADKQLILNTAVDVQTILQLLVEKEIVTREEVENKRNIVRNSQKYKMAQMFIGQTKAEIDKYKADPKALIQEMFKRKMEK